MTTRRPSCAARGGRDDVVRADEKRFVQRWFTLTEACELLSRVEHRSALAAFPSREPSARRARRGMRR